MNRKTVLPLSLFLMRISIFVVMLMWALDQFVNPDHYAIAFKRFYLIADLGRFIMVLVSATELLTLAGFVLGIYKKFCYAATLLMHAVSTLPLYQQYLTPFEGQNLLLFPAWPMLAGCLMLYLLRDEDVILTLDAPSKLFKKALNCSSS